MMSPNRFIPTAFAVVALAWTGTVLGAAEECGSDADCGAGYSCIKGASIPGCENPPDCPEPEVIEEDLGHCVADPVTCESDADCDEYLTCQAASSSDCSVSSDGSSSCGDPDPNEPKHCVSAPVACSADADCPREFECVSVGGPCPEIACADPDDPACQNCGGRTTQACQPKQIECDEDTDCPSAWSCISGATLTLLPGNSSSESRFCSPDAFGGSGYPIATVGSQEGDGLGSPNSDARHSSDGASAGGGCSVSAAPLPGAMTGWLLPPLLAMGPWLRRRLGGRRKR